MASANAADTKKQHYELSIMDQFFQWSSVSFKIEKETVFNDFESLCCQGSIFTYGAASVDEGGDVQMLPPFI